MVKNGIKTVTKIILGILIISIALDRLIFYGLYKMSNDVYSGQAIGKYNYYKHIKDNLDLIILGSSRASRHFIPDSIYPNGYNMGMDGTKLAYSATLLLDLKHKDNRIILFQIDPAYAVDSTYSGSDIKILSPEYPKNNTIRKSFDELNQSTPLLSVYNTISYNGNILGLLYNYIKGENEFEALKGYQPNPNDKNQIENLKKAIEKKEKGKNDCFSKYKINKTYLTFLHKLKNHIEKEQLNVIFLTSPIYNDPCKNDDKALMDLMKQLELTYINDAEFFKNNNQLIYWKDPDHLTNAGAIVYSKRVKYLIDSIR